MYRPVLPIALYATIIAPLSAQSPAPEDVNYSQAMGCSSLYTVLAGAVEGEPDYYELVDHAARWLVIATYRDGRAEIVPEDELQDWVSDLQGEIEARQSDESREAFLLDEIDGCAANHQLIATEFDSIQLD